MNYRMRIILFALIGLAAAFGFMAGAARFGEPFNPAALHIFLFNLVAGGLVLTTRSRGRDRIDGLGAAYLGLGAVFVAGAAFNYPGLVCGSAVVMAALVESVRWRRFSWFPYEFFTGAPVWRKFEQASLLCLSLGLIICAGSVFGPWFLHWDLPPKLDLHIFFLGFSFPLSLMFFSDIFRRLAGSARPPGRAAAEVCFWFLNLGVIVFFFAIIFENFSGQMVMALTLFSVVLLTGYFHLSRAARGGGWCWMLSGLGFLVVGSLTGIVYIAVLWAGGEYGAAAEYLLGFHAAATVFGWNLAWVIMVARDKNGGTAGWPRVLLHWLFVALLPAGRLSPLPALAASLAALLFLDRGFLAGRPDARSGER